MANNQEIKTDEKEAKHMTQLLRDILQRSKKVDRKTMINTWRENQNMQTITETADIPATPNNLQTY